MGTQDSFFAGEEGGRVGASDILVARTDLLVETEQSEFPSVNLLEAKLYLLSCLNSLASMNMLAGLSKAGSEAIEEQYGADAEKVLSGAERNVRAHRINAKNHFKQAYGFDRMPGDEEDKKRDTKEAFEEFKREYAPSHPKLNKYREIIRDQVATLAETHDQSVFDFVTSFNREFGLRPHDQLAEHKVNDDGMPHLNWVERVEVLRYDPRAGFIPSTRAELNIVIGLLDYLDNPEHPMGINSHLDEIKGHQVAEMMKQGRGAAEARAYADRSEESKVWEVGDFAIDAAQALVALKDLQSCLDEGYRPDLTLGDLEAEIGVEHPSYPYIFQFFDLEEFLQNGKVTGLGMMPLRSREHRFTNSSGEELDGLQRGKHKIIHSQYTRPDRAESMDRHFCRRKGQLKGKKGALNIREIREQLPEMIRAQQARLEFMLQRLQDVRGSYPEDQGRQVHSTVRVLRAISDTEAVVAGVFFDAEQELSYAA